MRWERHLWFVILRRLVLSLVRERIVHMTGSWIAVIALGSDIIKGIKNNFS